MDQLQAVTEKSALFKDQSQEGLSLEDKIETKVHQVLAVRKHLTKYEDIHDSEIFHVAILSSN